MSRTSTPYFRQKPGGSRQMHRPICPFRPLLRGNRSIRFSPFFSACGLCMLFSEIWKQYCLTFPVGGGSYNWWYFPFQLCSAPMYILLFLPYIKKQRTAHACLTFLMSFGLLGGIAVFADTTGLHYPLPALTIHSYMWHFLLILIGCFAAAARFFCKPPNAASAFLAVPDSTDSGQSPENSPKSSSSLSVFRSFADAVYLYFAFCAAASCINLICGRYGTINMFYINPAYPMEQILFSDLVPVLGNGAVILLYMAMTVLGAGILFLFWYRLLRPARRQTNHPS